VAPRETVRMTQIDPGEQADIPLDLARFDVLASAIAGTAITVRRCADSLTWTDCRTIFVTPNTAEPRHDIILQAALIAAGSFAAGVMRTLRGRPRQARRYLLLEGSRALRSLRSLMPPDAVPAFSEPDSFSHSPISSLAVAESRILLPEPPPWFGTIEPRRVLQFEATNAANSDQEAEFPSFSFEFDESDWTKRDNEDQTEATWNTALASLFRRRRTEGASRGENGDAGLRTGMVAQNARAGSAQTAVILARVGQRVGSIGASRSAVYPEWNARRAQYRRDWCTVVDSGATMGSVDPLERPARHDLLRHELGRLGLGLERKRRQPSGHDLDLDAAIASRVDIAAHNAVNEAVYIDNLRRKRELGVLILLDASDSGREDSPWGGTVHKRQRAAAAALLDTLSILGDRVASYSFCSNGRSRVTFSKIKGFSEPFGTATVARLESIQPANFTRFGAAIRHASHLLLTESGVAHRLLVIISDGFPYDDDYQGAYAEADVHRALEETRSQGIGCVCLSVGSRVEEQPLARMYGAAAHAHGADIDALAPSMGALFRTAITAAQLLGRQRPATLRERSA
jgi:nitric oxide reductase NorD protein